MNQRIDFEKVAQVALNYALVKAAAPAANDIVNMKSIGGALADYAAPSAWGGERAGRSKAMADAMDEPTTMGVKHPILSQIGHMLGGAGMGALAGTGVGASVLPFLGGDMSNTMDRRHAAQMLLLSALGGAGLGAVGGIPYSGYRRRQEMKRLNKLYDTKKEQGGVNAKHPEFSGLAAALIPDRGPHRTGQLEASRAIAGGKPISEQRPIGRDLLYLSRALPGGVGPAIGLLHSYGQNLRTQLADDTTSRRGSQDKEEKEQTKAANAVAYALTKVSSRQNAAPKTRVLSPAAAAAPAFNWQHALMGAGLGAGAGALSGLFAPGKDDEDEPDRAGSSMWRGLLGGALGGAAGGFGGKYVVPYFNNSKNKNLSEAARFSVNVSPEFNAAYKAFPNKHRVFGENPVTFNELGERRPKPTPSVDWSEIPQVRADLQNMPITPNPVSGFGTKSNLPK